MRVPIKDYLCNLKLLSLSYVHFQNECFSNDGRLQLRFPVLESLVLTYCTWEHNLEFVEINSPALTSFICYTQKRPRNDFLIKICGAMLETFAICGVQLTNFDLSSSSVVNATISLTWRCVRRESDSHSQLSFKELSGLKYLTLIGHITKVYAELKPGLPLPKFDKLQKLELTISGTHFQVLLDLLHMVPTLEKLIIHLFFRGELDSEDFNFVEVGSVPSCMLSHLTEIESSNFLGTTRELHWVKFLLKNSMKLEKVVFSRPMIPKADIKKLLSTYLKGSTSISVVFT